MYIAYTVLMYIVLHTFTLCLSLSLNMAEAICKFLTLVDISSISSVTFIRNSTPICYNYLVLYCILQRKDRI